MDNEWTQKSDAPYPLENATMGISDDKLYVLNSDDVYSILVAVGIGGRVAVSNDSGEFRS
ncbi:MAG: hypothetical protein PVH88_15345 [Ignavibacteria bacterium]|jgi:hypothetical protein